MTEKPVFEQRSQKIIGQQINIAEDVTIPHTPSHLIPYQIPTASKDFKDRDEELECILNYIKSGVTIIALCDIGGIGKTDLALVSATCVDPQSFDWVMKNHKEV